MPKSYSLSRTYYLRIAMVLFLAIGLLGTFLVVGEYTHHIEDLDSVRDVLIAERKTNVKLLISDLVERIEYQKDNVETQLKAGLSNYTDIAWNIANTIYHESQGRLTEKEIKKCIINSLMPIRFFDDRGYFWVHDTDHTLIAHPFRQKSIGKNDADLTDSKGQKIIRSFVQAAKTKPEGGFVTYYWDKPDGNEKYHPKKGGKKIAHLKVFEPFNWVIGVGEYLIDSEQQLQQAIVRQIATISLGPKGYVFNHTRDGVCLNHIKKENIGKNRWSLVVADGLKGVQALDKIGRQPGGGFMEYVASIDPETDKPAKKISYVKAVKDWGWVIGSGIYLTDIEKMILGYRQQLVNELRKRILMTILILIGVLVIAFLIGRQLFQGLMNELNLFVDESSDKKTRVIDLARFRIRELRSIAHRSNVLLKEKEQADAQLRKLSRAVEQSHNTIVITNLLANIEFVNPAFTRTTGYTKKEALGQNPRILKSDLQKGAFYHSMWDTLTAGNVWQGELQNKRKDGSLYWEFATISPVKDDAGVTTHYVAVKEDITARKEAESELNRIRWEQSIILDNIPVGVSFVKDQKFIWSNKMVTKLTGYRMDELMGTSLRKYLWSQKDYRRINVKVSQIIKRGKTYQGEWQMRRKDGREAYALLTATAVNPSDLSDGIIWVVDDITARKQIEKERERLIAAIEQVDQTVFITNTEGSILYANPAFEKTTGYTREEAFGKNPTILKSNKHDDAFYKNMWDTLKRGEAWSSQIINRKKDGTLYTEEATISPVRDTSGTIINYVAVKRDITHQIEMEEKLRQAQKMESIGLMAGGVAHDLNNILSGVVSLPGLLLQSLPKDNSMRETLEIIEESGKNAAAVVADLLTVARGVACKKTVCNLNSLIQEYFNSPEYDHLLSKHPDTVCQYKVETVQANILCSPVHVKKCLMNLVTNAFEAIIDKGTIVVSVYNQMIEDTLDSNNIATSNYIVLSVEDTGPGIKETHIENIFDPFFTKKVMGKSGTGLGLTVVWNTMKDHNGEVIVESTEKGTCFQLYFPLSKEETIVDSEKDEIEKFTSLGKHILVVDDEPQLRVIATKILQALGYIVDSVSSGELAIKFMKENSTDLIIIDMLMEPGINGLQTYKKIIEFKPDQKAIIASGFSKSGKVEAALRLGAYGFIQKPYSMDTLGRIVKEALNS